MKIDLNVPVKDFPSGKDDESGKTLAMVVAEAVIAKGNHGPEVVVSKVMPWAFRLALNDVLQIDKSDFQMLRRMVDNNVHIFPHIKLQILEVLDLCLNPVVKEVISNEPNTTTG